MRFNRAGQRSLAGPLFAPQSLSISHSKIEKPREPGVNSNSSLTPNICFAHDKPLFSNAAPDVLKSPNERISVDQRGFGAPLTTGLRIILE
jgi:hypothetical protein